MPITFGAKTGARKLRFTRNTSYAGADYGPDYAEDTALVEERYAVQFLRQGRAVEVKDEVKDEAKEVPVASAFPRLETRDPAPQHRDPAIGTPTNAGTYATDAGTYATEAPRRRAKKGQSDA